MLLTQGNVVAGKYRLERKLGAGGMGEVWSAQQLVTRKPVALKFLHDSGGPATTDGAAKDADTKRRFLREARAACAVRHPNVVEVHDVIELEDGSPVMVMELLDGESLEQRLAREGRMPLGDLAAVVVRVVAAVGTAHALGIVHRDLKPDNIFLVKRADGVDVKVLDFGIAKLTALEGDAAQTGGLTDTGAMLGTPYYMSPEQAFGEKRIDHRADVWSLGIILYRGLTGVLPTRADNIGQILKIIMTRSIKPIGDVAPELPVDVQELVMRMLTQDVAARPQTVAEVGEVLARHAGVVLEALDPPASNFGPPVSAASGSSPGVAGVSGATTMPPSRAPLLFGGGLLVAAVVAVGFVVTRPRSSPPPVPSALAAAPRVVEPPTAAPSASASASAAADAPAPSVTATASAPPSAVAPKSTRGRPAPPKPSAASAPAPAKTSVGGVLTTPPF